MGVFLAQWLGQQLVSLRYGLRWHRLDIHGIGVAATWRGEVSERQLIRIAWGAILAQTLLWATVTLVTKFGHVGQSPIAKEIIAAVTTANLWLLG